MKTINSKKEVRGELESIIQQVTDRLKEQGFGVLTRIDLHSRIKEKIGKDLAPSVILGACNPQLAYEAYLHNTDVASILPCNVVVREIGPRHFSVEAALPTILMEVLDDPALIQLAKTADGKLAHALDGLAKAG